MSKLIIAGEPLDTLANRRTIANSRGPLRRSASCQQKYANRCETRDQQGAEQRSNSNLAHAHFYIRFCETS
jgi:hypothetical protein